MNRSEACCSQRRVSLRLKVEADLDRFGRVRFHAVAQQSPVDAGVDLQAAHFHAEGRAKVRFYAIKQVTMPAKKIDSG